MNLEDEKNFAYFLVNTKKVLSPEKLKECFEVQLAMKKWGIEKSIDKVIVEKGLIKQEQMSELLKEYKGGDEELIIGYRILEKIGEGAMGEVYKALDLEEEKTVAIKILYPYLGKSKANTKRFLQEAKLCMDELNHPNIVKGYEVGYEGSKDFFFYVMEFVEGENLRQILKRSGVFSEELALEILYQMASALDYYSSHKFKLVHRDIKPDNIILTKNNIAKLCDLGLARSLENDELGLTRTGSVMGTPYYISPEGAKGLKLDIRSDIYSLGATIYHIVVGRVPFEGKNSTIVFQKHINEPLIPPIEYRPDISIGFSAIIEKMLEKDPEKRYQTPKELIEDIEKLKNNEKPIALIERQEKYGIKETEIKPKRKVSEILEAIPAETEEIAFSSAFNITSSLKKMESSEVDEKEIKENNLIENEIIVVDNNRRKIDLKDTLLLRKSSIMKHSKDVEEYKIASWEESREYIMRKSKKRNLNSKVIFTTVFISVSVLIGIIAICYIVIKILKNFTS